MPRRMSQTSFLSAISALPYASGIVYGIHRFDGPQKNAIIRSNIGSSGECWLKWADR
jgi:hypothetical protein